ncbi:MAG TPA: thioredoxin family protein [Gemmataceae bacterium]|nr:thioredoxin family protein [Gemmataceae bacterium]
MAFKPGQVMDLGTVRLMTTDLGFYIGEPAPKTEELKWEKDYASALKRAQAEKKPMLVMMTATWCGWCKKLEHDTLRDAWVRSFLSGFVLVKAFEDKDVEKRYGCSGYPTLVFTDSDGKLIHKVVGYEEWLSFSTDVCRGVTPAQLAQEWQGAHPRRQEGTRGFFLCDGGTPPPQKHRRTKRELFGGEKFARRPKPMN